MSRFLAGLLLLPGLQVAMADPTSEFWDWFAANEDRVGAEPYGPETSEDLAYWLARIAPGLSYEIRRGGRKSVLTLSSDGELRLFPIVDRLVEAAPRIRGWKVVSLRRRVKSPQAESTAGVILNPADLYFDLYEDAGRFGVVFYLPVFDPGSMKDYRTAAMRLMSQSVGEREVGAWIGFVDFDSQNVRDMEFSRPFKDFREVFDGLRK